MFFILSFDLSMNNSVHSYFSIPDFRHKTVVHSLSDIPYTRVYHRKVKNTFTVEMKIIEVQVFEIRNIILRNVKRYIKLTDSAGGLIDRRGINRCRN